MLKGKKVISLLVASVIGIGVFAGCGAKKDSKGEETSKEKKTITIGLSGEYYPFGFKKDGKLQGFEIDIWDEIGKRIDCKIEHTISDYSGLFGLLDSKKIDSISNQVAVTEEREKKYDFSVPYCYDRTHYVVKEDDNSVKTFKDLKGKKLGVSLGSVENEIIKKIDPNHEVELVNYSSASGKNNYRDVELGRIDAAVGPDSEGLVAIKEGKMKLKIVGEPLIIEVASYPFRKDAEGKALKEKVDKAIKDMHEDGTLTKLSKKWFDKDITKEIEK